MEQDIWQHYQSSRPGEVQVLGCDLFNCPPSGMQGFVNVTGATFPLLLQCASATGGNVQTLYGERDHYVIVNKQGIVRYQGNDRWPYSNGYHLDELRACIDSLVSQPVAVGDPERPGGFGLEVAPNPVRSIARVTLANPESRAIAARVWVIDLAGRRVATLWRGDLAPGRRTIEWNGRSDRGTPLSPGLYRIRGEIGSAILERRVFVVR